MKLPQIALVIRTPATLKDITSPSFDLCMAAIMQDGTVIKYVPDELFTRHEYKQLCEAAVKSKPRAFSLIKKEWLNGLSLDYIASSAVMKNGLALRWIKEQTPELCLKAIQQNPKAFAFVDKAMCDNISPHCYKLLKKAVGKKSAKEQQAKKRKRRVQSEQTNTEKIDLRYAEKQTEALCLKAVQQDGLQIQYVWKQTRKLCLAAVEQKTEAVEYIRDSDKFGIDDLFGNIAGNIGDIAESIGEFVFYCAADNAKKIPKTLKAKETQSQGIYYSQCSKALEENSCNIRFVKPGLLTSEQYSQLCIKAINEMPHTLKFINKADIRCSLYFSICLEMLNTVKPGELEECFSLIQKSLISSEQYYSLVQALLDRLSAFSNYFAFTLKIIDGKKLGKNKYYLICLKIISKTGHLLDKVKPHLLTKEQYRQLCFIAVKKDYAIIDVDSHYLDKKDWLELCKIALRKDGEVVYRLDAPNSELIKLALQNGGGLKYLKKQTYTQCLAVLKKNGSELAHVRPLQFTNEQYFKLCKTAVEKDANSLSSVDESALNLEQYRQLCETAINNFAGTIRFVEQDKIPPRLYHSWCLKALKLTPLWLDSIPFIDNYFNICLKAVKKDGKSLEYVKYLRLSPEQYEQVKSEKREVKRERKTTRSKSG